MMVRKTASSYRSTLERFVLTDAERDHLRAQAPHLAIPTGLSAEHEAFVQIASAWLGREAPTRLLEAIRRWRSEKGRGGVFVIDNLGEEPDLPPTPTHGGRSEDKYTSFSEMMVAAVGALLGEPFAFLAERPGLVNDLTPVVGKEASQTNEGVVSLPWHTEHAATGLLLPQPTTLVSHLVFFGLRTDPGGKGHTLFADIRDALAILDPRHEEVLRSASFLLRPPLLLRETVGPEQLAALGPRPVLFGPADAPQFQGGLYADLIEAIDPEGREALDALGIALDRVRYAVRATPGRLVLVNNHSVLHSRSPFEPRFDGTDRWLQRGLVTPDLGSLRIWQKRSSRVLEVA